MPKKKTSTGKSLVDKAHDSLMAKSPLYSEWHGHPHQHKVQMIVFVMVLAIIGGLFALKFQGFETVKPLESKADQDQYWMQQESKISDATKNLLNLTQDYRKADSDVRAELLPMMVDAAQQRFYMVAAAVDKRPEVVLHTAIPGSLRRNMPDEVAQYVEQETSKQGTFEWLHGDNFAQDTKVETFYLNNGGNKEELKFADGIEPNAITDNKIQVKGFEINNKIVVSKAQGSVQVLAATTSPVKSKVAVILFNFTNNTAQPYSPDRARNNIFTGNPSSNSYYQDASFGQQSLVGSIRPDGDVFGWYTLPSTYNGTSIGWNLDCPNNYSSTWTTLAEQAAAADGFVASNYNIIVYGFPQGQCGWNGISTIGGSPARSWINDNAYPALNDMPISVVTHELGHALTRLHASTVNCVDSTGARVAISSNCTLASEYGDPFDVMGYWGGMKQFGAQHKGITYQTTQSWLAPSNTQTLNRTSNPDGIYTIAPLESTTSGMQVLRIPASLVTNNSIGAYYYLEFHQPSGYDNYAATDPVVNGVLIRSGDDYNYGIPGGQAFINTLLLDTTPATSSYGDAALGVGQTFNDTVNGVTVTVQSVSAAGAVVRVTFTQPACNYTNPTVTASPSSQTVSAGLTGSYTVTVHNNDAANCASSTYDVTDVLPSGWTQTPSTLSLTVAPGASASSTILITSDPNAASANVTIPITATRQGGSNSSQTSVIYQVQAVDRTPPTVAITKPANGSTVGKGKLNISATAADNVYVTSIKLYVDSTLVKTCVNTTSCAGSTNGNNLSKGSHTIKAVAADYNGNSSTATITVTK